MDVKCLTCGEPWDVHHLWHDAIHDTGLNEAEIEAWKKLPQKKKLSDFYRQEFAAVGYEFGTCFVDVRRCPCCPKDKQPEPESVHLRAAITELLAGDEDGLAATLEDFGV